LLITTNVEQGVETLASLLFPGLISLPSAKQLTNAPTTDAQKLKHIIMKNTMRRNIKCIYCYGTYRFARDISYFQLPTFHFF